MPLTALVIPAKAGIHCACAEAKKVPEVFAGRYQRGGPIWGIGTIGNLATKRAFLTAEAGAEW